MQKLYERLFSFPVFRSDEVPGMMPEWSPRVSRQRLKDLVRQGRVGRVRLGVYFVVPPGQRPETTAVDPYLVGSRLAPDSVLAYHTALELLGTAQSATRAVYYVSARYRRPVIWRDVTFQRVAPPKALIVARNERAGVVMQERDGLRVSHSSRARTLVDCLDRLGLAGGLEELFHSIEAWPTIDPGELLTYLAILGKVTLYARVGYVLERFAGLWGLTETDMEPFHRRLPRSPVYLAGRGTPGRFVARWNLMVPAG